MLHEKRGEPVDEKCLAVVVGFDGHFVVEVLGLEFLVDDLGSVVCFILVVAGELKGGIDVECAVSNVIFWANVMLLEILYKLRNVELEIPFYPLGNKFLFECLKNYFIAAKLKKNNFYIFIFFLLNNKFFEMKGEDFYGILIPEVLYRCYVQPELANQVQNGPFLFSQNSVVSQMLSPVSLPMNEAEVVL